MESFCRFLDKTYKENYNHVFGNVYVVRTSAGLKQAIKHFGKVDSEQTYKDVLKSLRIETHLGNIKFPSVIEFQPFYFGYHGVHINHKKI